MSMITKCDHCKRRILTYFIEDKCLECYGLFCSPKCLENHICSGHPIRSLLDNECEDEYDGTELVHDIIMRELLTETDSDILRKTDKGRVGNQTECRRCFQLKTIIWDDIDFGPMCADCYRNLHSNFVAEISLKSKMDEQIDSEFRIMKLTRNIRLINYLSLLMAQRRLERRKYIDVVFEIAGSKINKKLGLYNLKVLFIDKITIAHISAKILELTPGIYIFIRNFVPSS